MTMFARYLRLLSQRSRPWRSATTRSSSSSLALRAAKDLTVSLVAEMDGRVIGHIALFPVTISDGTPNRYGLGPVSVLPVPLLVRV